MSGSLTIASAPTESIYLNESGLAARQLRGGQDGRGNEDDSGTSSSSGSLDPAVPYGDEVDQLLAKSSTLPAESQNMYDKSSTDIRLEFSQMHERKKLFMMRAYLQTTELGKYQFKARWGNFRQRLEAVARLEQIKASVFFYNQQIMAIDARMKVYAQAVYPELVMRQAMFEIDFDGILDEIFNFRIMYASGSSGHGKNYPRALKLSRVKTPLKVRYRFKKGWQKIIYNYSKEMFRKAKEERKRVNLAKRRIRKLLNIKLTLLSPSMLPGLPEVALKVKDMNTLRKAGRKNLGFIKKAMAYHSKNRRKYPEDYEKYNSEAKILSKSINNMLSSIDSSHDDIVKSYKVLQTMHLEVPKAVSLRKIAREMVRKGL
jgi:hypothetical protein